MADQDEILLRVSQLETRIAQLEAHIGGASQPSPAQDPALLPTSSPSGKRVLPHHIDISLWTTDSSRRDEAGAATGAFRFDYTSLMGVAGVGAIILAGIYLIALALSDGWLTPMRQVGLASIVGVVLVCAGFVLPGFTRYKSMLPAAGLSILYAAIYGGHAVHQLFSWAVSSGMVGGLTVFGLWLGHMFRFSVFAYVSMVGCFMSAIFLPAHDVDVATPVIFHLLWTLLFCGYAILTRSRPVYIAAGYFAVIGFDFSWRLSPGVAPWQVVVGCQFLIFFIVACTAAWYSIKHRSPLRYAQGMAHLPLMVLFYGVQYHVLSQNTSLAPWVSLGSALFVAGLYQFAISRLQDVLEGGALITSFYLTIVVVHVGFFELMPDRYLLWSSLIFLGGMGFFLHRSNYNMRTQWPLMIGFMIIFTLTCFAMLLRTDTAQVPAVNVLHFIFAVIPYALYVFADKTTVAKFAPYLLYIGHVNMMGAIMHFSPNRLVVSLLWSVLAMATMAAGYQRLERHLALSALLIFGGSAAKLLLYDLDGSTPLIRVGCLIAVGLSLYVGGWIYKKIDARIGSPATT